MTVTISICVVICVVQQLVAVTYAAVLQVPTQESSLTINDVYFSI
jgi:hypothetical protein